MSHDIVVIAEAHLKDTIEEKDIALEGFRIFWVERSKEALRADYGGVVLYVGESLTRGITVVHKDNQLPGCEVIWASISLSTGSSLLMGACYLAPETSRVYPDGGGTVSQRTVAAEAVFTRIQQSLTEVRLGDEDVLIAGDLNARLSGAQYEWNRATPMDLPTYVNDIPDLEQSQAVCEVMGSWKD
ncbi:hypothetical protein VOLCADRAFT_95294 [Volvox carteri f. nagariensis]|uniref:Endonuclease/exonuclease/phosphatase domain-containing protein n=1 Tax=Volvox carteri f. nagariensis TaxID=3068 RepID=D8U741_VOLCA|nr:uncharacterized protein VOLCADRAFT_95294 [Volvox carteri f. nagariensis]EFJ44413.1 hypothetical protein VOLCADRAFT_95294 [Volvox carteri f. nagariensis]|eukprot:XP_002954520.1 hypothetical protein VOLCADRAFT_95294 [Volvox carteri f. nagariensis]